MSAATTPPPLRTQEVTRAWWPLAASWLLMGLELPAVSAVVARLPNPEIHLAAYGGIVFPVSLLIESPIIMLLAASTALCKDWDSYVLARRFMWMGGLGFTALHALVAFTPLYDVVASVLGIPPEVRGPGRIGLQIMTPWTASIAYRRFQQGVLIRFGHSYAVGIGTIMRLSTNLALLSVGWFAGWSGIVTGTVAVAGGVMAEALYAAIVVRPVLSGPVSLAKRVVPPLTNADFLRFYMPLSVTPMLLFLAMPLSSAAIGRMPETLASLAAWPVVNGLVFTLRSVSFALNEVTVALLDRPRSAPALRRFTGWLAAALTALLLAVALTPLADIWFVRVSALDPALAYLAYLGLLCSLPLPALTTFMSFYQGIVVHSRRTRGVIESMAIFLAVMTAGLVAGIAYGRVAGLPVTMAATSLGALAQVAWLRFRAKQELALHESALTPAGITATRQAAT